jgi:hypothetical protein
MSYFYSEPSLIPPPSVPNLFDERIERDDGAAQDVLPDASRILTPGIFKANCVLSELFYRIMTFNTTTPVTEGADVSSTERAEFFAELEDLQASWRSFLRTGDHFRAQICYFG